VRDKSETVAPASASQTAQLQTTHRHTVLNMSNNMPAPPTQQFTPYASSPTTDQQHVRINYFHGPNFCIKENCLMSFTSWSNCSVIRNPQCLGW